MKKIGEFFDKLEEKLEGKHKRKKRMDYFIQKRIAGAFAFVGMDLLMLISLITGVDLLAEMSIIVLIIIGLIATEICCHRLNKRIAAQETEELAEDLEDDIDRMASMALIVAVILFFILGLVYVYQ